MRFYGLLLLTSVLWAGNFVVGGFLAGHTSPLTITDVRWAITVLCLIPVVYSTDKRILPPRRAVLPLILMALTGAVFFNVFMYLALKRTSADNVGLLSALNPVAIALASFLLLREKLRLQQVAGMLVSLIGVLIVVSHGNWERVVHFQLNLGDLLMLAAVGTWGLYSVAGKFAMRYVSPYMATLWAGAFGVAMMLPFDLPTLSFHGLDASFWKAILYTSIAGTVIAMVLWNIGVQRVGGTKSGMFLNFNPIFTAILSYLWMGETVHAIQVVGTVVVILGVSLFSLPLHFRSSSQQPAS